MKKLYLAVMACFAVMLAHPQAGNYVAGYTYPTEEILNAALDANGNTIVVGQTASGTGFARRLSPTGVVDPTFTINFQVPRNLVFVQSDGNIIIGRLGPLSGNPTAPNVVYLNRYLPSGALDLTFSHNFPNGTIISAVAQQQVSNQLLIAVATNAGSINYGVVRLTSGGSVDTTFTGATVNNPISALYVIPGTNDFYACGKFTLAGGAARNKIARFNGAGTLHTWQYNNANFIGIHNVATDSNGNVIFVGIAQGSGIVPCIYKVSNTGSLLWTKGVNQLGYGEASGVAVHNNLMAPATLNKIVITGNFDHIEGYNAYPRRGIVRLNEDGTLDTCFDPGNGATDAGGNPTSDIANVIIDKEQNIYLSSGRMITAGGFVLYNNLTVPSFVKINGAGTGFTPMLVNDSGTTTASGGVVLNVLSNDTVNGQPATVPASTLSLVSAPTGLTLATTGATAGQVSVAPNTPAGTYTLTYKLCFGTSNCYCSTATTTITVTAGIVAYDDSYTTLSQIGGTYNILGNDLNGTAAASTSNVNVTLFEAPPGFTINSSGQLVMVPGLANGTYTVTYQICDKTNTTVCDTADVTIVKNTPVVDAVNDVGSAIAGTTTIAVPNVLVNDKNYNTRSGNAALANVYISQLGSSNEGVYIESESGAVYVDASVPPGTYTLVYEICTWATPTACDTATVTITVAAPPAPDAVNDTITVEIGEQGFLNILANDTFAGQAATISNVTISVVGTYPANGPFLSTATGDLHVPSTLGYGTYTFTYQICGGALTSCDTATVTVNIVSPSLIPGIRADNNVYDLALQSNGNVVIAGNFTSYNYISKNQIALLSPSLELFPFSSTGPTTGGSLMNIETTPDNSILAAGLFTGFNGVDTPNGLVKLTASGTLDTTFDIGGSGVQENESIRALAFKANGNIIAVGMFKKYNGQLFNNIIGLTANGTPDPSFVSSSGLSNVGTAIARQGNKFLIGHGGASPYHGTIAESIFRINENGTLDASFQQKSFGYISYQYPNPGIIGCPYEIMVQSDDHIVVVGEFISYDGISRNRIVKLLPNGGLDTSFDPGTGFNGPVNSVIADNDGNIYCGGSFTTYNNQPVKTIVKLSPNGSLITSFNIGTGPQMGSSSGPVPGTVYKLLLQGDNKILLGGRFVVYNSAYAGFVTRIHPSTPGTQSRMGTIWEAEPAVAAKAVKASIYPNPSNGIFIFDMPMAEEQPYDITIHNALGQEVFRGTVNSQASQIDLSTMDAGNYFVRIQNNNETINKIITKK